MSNTVKTFMRIQQGVLTPEDVDEVVYGKEMLLLAKEVSGSNYYRALLEKSGRISIRIKHEPPLLQIARLAILRNLSLTLEHESLDNGEVGSLQINCFAKDQCLEEGVKKEDYYRQGNCAADVSTGGFEAADGPHTDKEQL